MMVEGESEGALLEWFCDHTAFAYIASCSPRTIEPPPHSNADKDPDDTADNVRAPSCACTGLTNGALLCGQAVTEWSSKSSCGYEVDSTCDDVDYSQVT